MGRNKEGEGDKSGDTDHVTFNVPGGKGQEAGEASTGVPETKKEKNLARAFAPNLTQKKHKVRNETNTMSEDWKKGRNPKIRGGGKKLGLMAKKRKLGRKKNHQRSSRKSAEQKMVKEKEDSRKKSRIRDKKKN